MENTSSTPRERFTSLGRLPDSELGQILARAVKTRALLIIHSEPDYGGEARALRAELQKLDVRQVTVKRLGKGNITIGDINGAVVLELAPEERLKARCEAAARQVKRIVEEASRKGEVVLVIEEVDRVDAVALQFLDVLRELTLVLVVVGHAGNSEQCIPPGE